jgi:hypothetical protein
MCPLNGSHGKNVQIITLKSLLNPLALETLNPNTTYFFCDATDCPVVYFSGEGQIFTVDQVKVPVFQKHQSANIPICYCFNWSLQRIQAEIEKTGSSRAIESITEHIKARRCGCEVNNPQGSCCLKNIKQVLQ